MTELVFRGRVVNGIGKHVELIVPGKADLAQAPADWPGELCPGSVNVRIAPDGYPEEFSANRLPLTVTSLDGCVFGSAFEIRQAEFGNNRLRPLPQNPRRGDAQVWRARLIVQSHDIPCWVLRRFGSGLTDQLEIVSHQAIRQTYGLSRDADLPATVRMVVSLQLL